MERLLDDGTHMVFVTAGMGGGTGTGAAPVVASVAKAKGILTVGVVTIPFFFEKRNKIISALKGVEELRNNVDALLIVNNERLCDVYSDSDITLKESFKRADDILKDAVKSISELITVYSEGSVNLDFREVEMQPVHKAVYLLFLNHPEGIEFKRLSEHADELRRWYRRAAPNVEQGRIDDAVARLTNPLDNAINEKCSRIKSIFMSMMDEYTASYYIIAGHSRRSVPGSKKMWFTRCRRIGLPRELLSCYV